MRLSISLPPSPRRRALALAVTVLAATVTTVAVDAPPAHAATACDVTYQKSWDNGAAFGGNITIRNLGDPLTGWTLAYTWPGSQRVTDGWSAVWSQTGAAVTARNAPWNGALAPDATVTIGFNGTYTGTNADPAQFSVNGTVCARPDPPQLAVTSPAVTVPEGGIAAYGVRLTARPSGTVTVTSTAGAGDADIRVTAGATLTFTPANWATNQSVTLSAAEDGDSLAGLRQIAVTAPGMNPLTVTATESENDICICLPPVNPTSVTVPEGGSGTFTIRLPSPPPATVVTSISPGGGDPDLTLCSPGILVFTPANWNVPQTVVICAAEDADTVNGTRTFVVGMIGMTPITVTATEVDNDTTVGKVDNPYLGATGYLNPDWRARVENEAVNQTPTLAAAMRAAGRQPTAVWLDRIAAITDGGAPGQRGLAAHLDVALAQDAANGVQPVVLTLVLYNLPNRSCAAPANGELDIAANGLGRYRTEYVDAIRAILARPQYANLRVAVVVEPDSLVNMVTHHQARPITTMRCIEAQASAVYREGIRYAVGQLSSLPNSYLYVDISTSAWLGWAENLSMAVDVYDNALAAAQGGPGYDKIHGFAVNTAGYTPTEEVFLPDPVLTVGGAALFTARFYEFNLRFDDRDLARDLLAAFAGRGCTGCGVLIDTSRNGWGGPARPVTLTVTGDVHTYVDANRLDRRPSRLGGCNQVGAGLGARPTSGTGIVGVDAFVWVKPPGESDGVSQPGILDEFDPFRTHDPMCDPTRTNRYAPTLPTNAMPGAPHRGRWFGQQFAALVQNAHPSL